MSPLRVCSAFLLLFVAVVFAATSTASAESADELVVRALTAEVRGDNTERNELLARAIKSDAGADFARWNAGQLRVDDEWTSVEAAAEAARGDKRLAEYARRRAQSKLTLAGQSRLARWCERNGLTGPAAAHWTVALRLNNESRAAQQALGVTRFQGAWLTLDEAATTKQAAKQRAERRREFVEEFASLQKRLASDEAELVAEAIKEIEGYSEPFDILMLINALHANPAPEAVAERVAASLLDSAGRIDAPWAVDFAVHVALHSMSSSIRQQAVDSLSQRSLTEYAPAILSRVRMPTEVAVEVTKDANGNVLSYYEEYQEGPAGNDYQRRYRDTRQTFTRSLSAPIFQTRLVSPARTIPARIIPAHTRECGGGTFTVPAKTIPAKDIPAQYETSQIRTAYGGPTPGSLYRQQAATQQAYQTASYKRSRAAEQNAYQDTVNANAASLLSALTGEELSSTPRDLWSWWQQKWDSDPKLRDADQRSVPAGLVHDLPPGVAAGTVIQTRTGPRPIEELTIGDEVLAKSPETGELAYKPILSVFASQGYTLNEVLVGGSRIGVAPGQWVWSTGEGWRLPQDLHPRSLLHGLGGSAPAGEQRDADTRGVYSLVVADFHSFFVGGRKTLVHDASPPTPTDAATPGWSPIAPVNRLTAAGNQPLER